MDTWEPDRAAQADDLDKVGWMIARLRYRDVKELALLLNTKLPNYTIPADDLAEALVSAGEELRDRPKPTTMGLGVVYRDGKN